MEAASWTKTLVPGGEMGVALKSNFPLMAAWAERIGFVREERRRLIVVTAWGMIWYPLLGVKVGVARGKADAKMILECVDCTFGGVAAVGVRGNNLEGNVVFAEGFLNSVVALVVKDVDSGFCTVLL